MLFVSCPLSYLLNYLIGGSVKTGCYWNPTSKCNFELDNAATHRVFTCWQNTCCGMNIDLRIELGGKSYGWYQEPISWNSRKYLHPKGNTRQNSKETKVLALSWKMAGKKYVVKNSMSKRRRHMHAVAPSVKMKKVDSKWLELFI